MDDALHLEVDRKEALALYRKYKEHAAYSDPIDWEIQRTYQLLSQGKVVIKAIESVRTAGLNEKGLPKLALGPATSEACHIQRHRDGSMVMSPTQNFWRDHKNQHRFAAETFTFEAGTFPVSRWASDGRRETTSEHRAITPIVPVHLRPKRGMDNYHILWEAEWERVVPKDPYLLRRIGKADLWLVLAAWDLTEVERAALATRLK